MRHLALPALLATATVACSDHGSPLAPADVPPISTASSNAGPPIPIEDSYTSGTCSSFLVLVELTGKLKELSLPGDRTKVLFPGFTATLTNLATGKQATISNTGTFHIAVLPNGNIEFVYTGRNTYDDPVAGTFYLLIGTFNEIYDPAFNVVQPLQGRGQVVDICELLA